MKATTTGTPNLDLKDVRIKPHDKNGAQCAAGKSVISATVISIGDAQAKGPILVELLQDGQPVKNGKQKISGLGPNRSKQVKVSKAMLSAGTHTLTVRTSGSRFVEKSTANNFEQISVTCAATPARP